MIEILLVDDEPIVGKRLKPALEKRGYEVEFFDDGAAAIERLGQHRFDVVVTDMRMGPVNGNQVLAAALAGDAETRVIVVSGYATMEMAREAQAKGAFEVLAKPLKPNDLRKAIERACNEKERRAQ